MQNIKKSNLNVGSLGTFDLKLPIITVGKNTSRILVINNLHGNEVTGFYVIEEALRQKNLIKDGVTFLVSGNPLGLLEKRRVMPLDNVDLNRGYPPAPKERGVHVSVKNKILELCEEYDVVIDLHTFIRPAFSAGMAVKQSAEELDQRMEQCFTGLGLDMVYQMDFSSDDEKHVSSALMNVLAQKGKLAFAVEYPPIRVVTHSQILKYAKGLVEAINFLANGSIHNIDKPVLNHYYRRQIINTATGLFEPIVELGQKVHKGDVVGNVINPGSLEKLSVVSPYSGVIAEIADRQLYVMGEKLVTVAVPVD